MHLTDSQKKVYEYIRSHLDEKGMSPSYDEIRQGLGFKSLNAVAKHLKQLERRGVLKCPWGNRKRALELISLSPKATVIPLLGWVAAGKPIEPVETPEEMEVPEWLLAGGENFALTVEGFSMVEDGIRGGDVIIVRKQGHADNGQTVVALVDGEATVKKFFLKNGKVELKPANEQFAPLVVESGKVKIIGVVVGLYRKYLRA